MNNGKNQFFDFFAAEGSKLNRYVKGKMKSISDMDAEDIVSEVMLSVFNQTQHWENPIENLAGYVYTSLRNKIADHRRKSARMVSLQNFMDEKGELMLRELLSGNGASVSGEAERREAFRRLGQAVSALDPKQRAVFIATEINGKTFKELSVQWGEPVGTLLSRKSRATAALREMLADLRNDE